MYSAGTAKPSTTTTAAAASSQIWNNGSSTSGANLNGGGGLQLPMKLAAGVCEFFHLISKMQKFAW